MRSIAGWTGSIPGCPFERYADDIVAHCDTEEQAQQPAGRHRRTARGLGPGAAPRKDEDRVLQRREPPGDAEHTSFDFLGYTFRGRLARGRRGFFVSFLPAMSTGAKKAKGQQIRAWHLNRRTGTDLSGLAEDINAQVRGWINYYGAFYHSELFSLARRIDEHLVRWAMHKFKRLGRSPAKARTWLAGVKHRQPTMFAHWQVVSITRRRSVGAV